MVIFMGWSAIAPEGLARIPAADNARQYLIDELIDKDLAAIASKTSTLRAGMKELSHGALYNS